MHIYIYIHMRIYIYVHLHMYVYVYYIYIYICIHTHVMHIEVLHVIVRVPPLRKPQFAGSSGHGTPNGVVFFALPLVPSM